MTTDGVASATAMGVAIDPSGPAAPFEQVRVQLLDAVTTGVLHAGARLPTVRALAADLGVAPGTVARAYRELEASGVIETRGRAGTFVAWDPDPVRRQMQQAAQTYAQQARALGVSPDDALAIAATALRVSGAGG